MSRYTPLFYAIKSDLGIPKKLTSYDDELFAKINNALSSIDNGKYQMASKDDVDIVEALETDDLIYEAYHYILSSMIIELNFDEPPTRNSVAYSDKVIEQKNEYQIALQNRITERNETR